MRKQYFQPKQFVRKDVVLSKFPFGKSTLYNRIEAGVFPPPLKLGGRAAGWPLDELDQIFDALLAEWDNEQLKQLVAHQLASRKQLKS